ncbi:MAG TPA: hypothetical protein VGR56_04490 [Nitrososphaerales archaeon]|nr:hypothetical protein [Nitrososphaerales archaeon]
MSVSEVIAATKKFLREQVGFESIRISSVVAVEGESNWKVNVEIWQPATDKKEIIVDDRYGRSSPTNKLEFEAVYHTLRVPSNRQA